MHWRVKMILKRKKNEKEQEGISTQYPLNLDHYLEPRLKCLPTQKEFHESYEKVNYES